MSKEPLPTIFVSHGAPTLPLENIPAKDFLMKLGPKFGDINAVLCISAHWETSVPTVNAIQNPETIHDFYGFPEELYRIRYPALGDPELAQETADLIENTGLNCNIDKNRGIDHGTWVPLMLMFPDADIPVFQLSIQHHLDPAKHLELGRAISDLREKNVLIIGSGGAVHPLGYANLRIGAKTDDWAIKFDQWLTGAVTNGNWDLIVKYRELAPYPERAHPYPDHYMPLAVAFGAAGKEAKGEIIHHSWYAGDLGMAAYVFKGPYEVE
ncbi:MAG TPA: class III extradiol ring-cleavage dioxygenase [Methanobacterium sp.]|nr:class III extradiol ring-cleavage dioxygenase [Methanobacterium sp.]